MAMSSDKSHPKRYASHHENLFKVCLQCFKKCNGDKLTELIKSRLIQIKPPSLPFEDERIPKVICGSCRKMLSDIIQGKISIDALPSYDFSSVILRNETRGSDLSSIFCNCLICDKARQMGAKPKANVGHPKSESSQLPSPVGSRCSKCLTMIAKGIKHECSKKSLLMNMEKISEKNPKTSDIFVSNQIKKKVEENQSQTVSLATKGMPCTITSQSQSSKAYVPRALFPEDKAIPSSEISKIQVALNLSNSQTSKMCSMMKSLKGRSSIEPYTDQNLRERDRKLERFFECKKLLFDVQNSETKKVEKVERRAVVCNDVDALVKFIIAERDLNFYDTRARIGFDGGKGSLKVTLNILTKEKDDLNSPLKKSTRYSYSEGSQAKKFQDSGVKKLIVIGVVEDVKETYDNMELLLKELDLEKIEHFTTLDLKALNAICGIESASSATHCCPYCETPKCDFDTIDEKDIVYRSVGSLYRHYEAYRLKRLNSSAKCVPAIENKNVSRKPLIKAPPDVLTLDLFPPMELHLKLGIVNNLCKHLDEALISKKCPMKLSEWYGKSLNIRRPKYHSGEFEGNQCNKLLNNLDELQRMIENSGFQTASVALPYLQALRNFKTVRESCFGKSLEPHHKDAIKDFKRSIVALPNASTLKMHIVYSHVSKFCSTRKRGLSPYSEQSTESCHSDFHAHRQNFKLPPVFHQEYSEKFLKCVVAYNSRHI